MKPVRDPERAELNHLLAVCPLTDKEVLEIGSGDGTFTRQYAHLTRHVVGIDPLPSEVQLAMNKRPPVRTRKMHYLLGKAEKLPFPDQSFEVVLFAASL